MKLVDTLDLGSSASQHGGSSPSTRTIFKKLLGFFKWLFFCVCCLREGTRSLSRQERSGSSGSNDEAELIIMLAFIVSIPPPALSKARLNISGGLFVVIKIANVTRSPDEAILAQIRIVVSFTSHLHNQPNIALGRNTEKCKKNSTFATLLKKSYLINGKK